MLSTISTPLLLVNAAVIVFFIGLVTWVLLRFRGLRNELDDQGIKLIQLTNTGLEQKKEIATLQSTVTSVIDHLERTNIRKQYGEYHGEAGSGHGMSPELEQVHAARASADIDEAATRVRFNDSGKHDTSEDEAVNLADEAHPDEVTGSKDLGDGDDFVDNDAAGEVSATRRSGKKNRGSGKEVALKREYLEMQQFVQEMTGNISKVGLFLAAKELLPVGTRVEMELRLKNQDPLIRCKGEVKRVHLGDGGGRRNQQGMDIRFIYIDPASKETIRRLVGG